MRFRDILPLFTFVGGVAIGAYSAWELLKETYEERIRVEVESVKKAFENRAIAQNAPANEEPPKTANEIRNQNDLISYANIIKEKTYAAPPVPDISKRDGPYVISPDEYGELYDYRKVTIIYFADGALSDNEYDILTNTEVEESFGYECLDHFGEFEEDTVYVRNDAKRCDYEIQKDLRNYSELDMDDV